MRKVRITVVVDEPVAEALEELRLAMANEAAAQSALTSVARLPAPLTYSKSTAVQAALLHYMKFMGVTLPIPITVPAYADKESEE